MKEIITTRTVNASPEHVFKAWTHPHYLALWWGPKDFRNTFHEFDLKPGGAWNFVMHGPNGVDYPNSSQFVEIKIPNRLVLNHISKPQFQIVVTFEEAGSQTKVTFRQIFPTKDEADKIRAFVTEANEQNMDRMEAVVAEMILDRSNRELIAHRMFDATPEEVYSAWTDSKQLSQWWGTNGLGLTTHSIDVKAGGLWRFLIHSADGTLYPNRVEYIEAVQPSLLSYVQGTDQEPEQFKTMVHLERVEGQTKVTMKVTFPTPQAFEAAKKSKSFENSRQTLDRLATFLAKKS
ncbi:MAG: SRPBCC domain-containing protein [Bdellovibrionales bacterium]|nr:SRPBCC domain-containing protein [Bdellovibrionales bacterium]